MPNIPDSTTHAPDTVHRTVRLRLFPGDAKTGILLTAIAGACRYVWNHMLADCEWRYARWKEMHVPALNWPEVREGKTAWAKGVRKKMGPGPSTSFFTLGQRFTELRNDPDHAWLKDCPYKVVRYSLKYLADAYARYKADPENVGKPRFKARHFTVPAFTIPEAVRMDGDHLYVPKVGWLRLAGSNPYAGCRPLTVRVRMEGTEQHPQWYVYVCYEVPGEQVRQPAADGALGLDRNVGQATDSEGTVYAMPNTDRLDARIARKQRELSRKQGWGPKDRRPKSNRGRRVNGQLNKLQRKGARKRDNATHQASRKLADTAHTVVVEDLNTKGMTKSAKGTVEAPGKQVKQKSGLNRAILASGWGSLERKLAYKAGALLKVDPAYTSQTCSRCGHVDRKSVVVGKECTQRQPAVAGGVRVRGLRVPCQRRPQCGGQHFGACGASVRARFGPWDRGGCTARGDSVGDPDDP